MTLVTVGTSGKSFPNVGSVNDTVMFVAPLAVVNGPWEVVHPVTVGGWVSTGTKKIM